MKRLSGTILLLMIAAMIVTVFCLSGSGGRTHTIVNPARQAGFLDEYEGLEVLYGDPHVHTNLSDGTESPDFALRYARDVADLDWCCITDHAETLAGSGSDTIEYYRSLPGKYDDPGLFCVLFGYEWTSNKHGHRNVYTTDNNIPLLPSNDPSYSGIEMLWDGLSGYDVITVVHHPMIWSDIWWKHTNPGVETCVEFYSKWGLSLTDGNERPLPDPRPANGVYVALAEGGLRYGLMAGTDSHMSRPGSVLGESPQEGAIEYSQPGLTGVWATSHSREAIYDALKNRHCYGMTGTRVMLQFSVNDHIMGSEISASDPPSLIFRASCEILIQQVTLLKIHAQAIDEIEEYHPDALEIEGSFVDIGFTDDAAYFIRVDLENTDMALSTPVWVDRILSN